MFGTGDMDRYRRQLDLWGVEGQEALRRACVVIAGCGGLGSVVATYLACAGVGFLRLVDFDRVDPSNLNRQFLHWPEDIGKQKCISFKEKIAAINLEVAVEAVSSVIQDDLTEEIIGDADLIVDALDNFSTRFILNNAAVKKNIPLIHGAVQGFSGQVATILPGRSACLRCMFPDTPLVKDFPIAGATCGVIGSIQATEAIKYITGQGECLVNRILLWRGEIGSFDVVPVRRDPSCEICSTLCSDAKESKP